MNSQPFKFLSSIITGTATNVCYESTARDAMMLNWQRAMIALALACSPSVLLADEPTTALDVTVQIPMFLFLRQLQQELGMAVVFVTHDVGVAAEISDRMAVMYAGQFVETGAVRDVLRDPRHPYTAGLLGSTVHGAMRGTPLNTVAGGPPSLAHFPPGCALRHAAGLRSARAG